MLRLEHISVAYGKHEALHDVSLDVVTGKTTVILGANGAGKTTLLKTIAGLVRPQPGGRVLFEGRPIEHEPPHQIVAAGIALVPEGRRLFGDMTVVENLQLGAYVEHARADADRHLEKMLELFPRLAERRSQLAKTMSGGEQQMLAIARALMSEPKILLLDEPSLGLSPRLVKDLFETLRTITKGGQSVVLVEQNVHHSLRLADHVYVLENGRIHSHGSPRDILQDTVIQQAYLGRDQRRMAEAAQVAQAAQAAQPDLTAAAPPPRPAYYAGGFVHPSARPAPTPPPPAAPVAAADAPRPEQARRAGVAGGFAHPYARSVNVKQNAAKLQGEAAPAPRVEPPARSGGFVNPFARNVPPQTDRSRT